MQTNLKQWQHEAGKDWRPSRICDLDYPRQKGVKTASDLKDIVRKNINRVDLRLARVVMVNNMRFGAFLDDTYESVGLATNIVID